jgi:hypothetical protein
MEIVVTVKIQAENIVKQCSPKRRYCFDVCEIYWN